MRDGPTTQPAKTAAHPHPSNPPVTGLKDDPESAALKRSNGRAINPSFIASLPPLFPEFTVQNVIPRTSAPVGPPQGPTFAAASPQNAAVALRSNDTRDTPTDHAPLIYGTGIKKLWKPTPIDEYKLLIYGKPHPGALSQIEFFTHHEPRVRFTRSHNLLHIRGGSVYHRRHALAEEKY
jgi:hypothetical protein